MGHSYTKDRKVLMNRLSRLEGQVRGIGRMVDGEEYCVDILQQIAALRAAVDAAGVREFPAGNKQLVARKMLQLIAERLTT